MKLTETEMEALLLVHQNKIASDDLPGKAGKDDFGRVVPGARTYIALDRLGLIVLTEEDETVLDDGTLFTFTPFAELTEAGRRALKSGFSENDP